MFPMKEVSIICAIIASPQLCITLSEVYQQIVYVDEGGRILLDATDPRRSSAHYSQHNAVSSETLAWYKKEYPMKCSLLQTPKVITDTPAPKPSLVEPEESKMMSQLDAISLNLPTL